MQRALEGEVSEHHRFLLRQLLDQYDFLEKEIAGVSERLGAVAPPSFRAAVEQLESQEWASAALGPCWRKPGPT